MIHFKHRLQTTEEVNSLKQYCLTQNDIPWTPSSFSDQVADKFYQQVIDNEQKSSMHTSLILLLILWLNQKFPSCHTLIHLMLMENVSKEKYANLVFHQDAIVMNNNNVIHQLNKHSFSIAKPYLLKLTMRNNHPTLHSA
jgi:hypothetical protein